MESEYKEDRKTVRLQRLFLDPNNFRFIDKSDYAQVPDIKIKDPLIQKRTRRFIAGTNNDEIDDLIRSYKANGYLPVDQIQARPIDENDFLIIEGNRRITALKFLHEQYEEGFDIGNLDPIIFSRVPIIITTGVDESHYKILMGLKHISGNKKWPSINQAQLLKNLLDEGMTRQQVKDALGISTVSLNRYLKSLSLIEEYKSSDYGDQFKTDKFNLFSEAIKQPKIMQWLGWDDNMYISKNVNNRNRFFSWISIDDDQTITNDDDIISKLDPIITRGDDMRDLAQIIGDERLLDQMEKSRSISQAYLSSNKLSSDKFENSLEIIEKNIGDAFNFARYATEEGKYKLSTIRKKIDGLIATQGYAEVTNNKEIKREIIVKYVNDHFSNISIGRYKQLQDIEIIKLKRINLFGGNNNTGKSSLLESVYFLCIVNDIFSYTEIQRRRGKYFKEMPSVWLAQHSSYVEEVSGIFDSKAITNNFFKSSEDENFDKSSYLTTLFLNGSIKSDTFNSKMRLFENRDSQVYFTKISNLCNVAYSSPFSIHNKEDLLESHQKSVATKSIERILDFIKQYIDSDIVNIELTGEGETQRFLVTHRLHDSAFDITQFGDGLQRIFQISLLFASAQNGILLIDEIENAIHHDLFTKFALFIENMSQEYNVQLFITSHSKECIDSFFMNGNSNSDISAYRLEEKNGKIRCIYTEGERFGRMIKNFNTDLRG